MTPVKEFKVFQKKFVWTRTKIINSIILLMISICFLMFLLFKIERSSIQTYLLTLSLILMTIGYGFKLNGFYKIQQLQGNYIGSLIFCNDYIEINNTKTNLHDIKKIEITGVDWYGLQTGNYILAYYYENGLSNGIENHLIIKFNDNKKIKVQFQISYASEFTEIEQVIKYY